MRNWRELGEVPDSDDDNESLDDLESQQDQQAQQDQHFVENENEDELAEDGPFLPAKASVGRLDDPKPKAVHQDQSIRHSEHYIEDEDELAKDETPPLPKALDASTDDSEVHNEPAQKSPDHLDDNDDQPLPRREDSDVWSVPSSPLSPPPSQENETPDIFSTNFQRGGEETAYAPDEPPPVNEADFPIDDISASYVRDAALPPRASPSTPVSNTNRQSSPSLQRIDSSQAQNHERAVEEEQHMSRQTAVRLERSLRPRKPIQQHPYLLENAQYSTFMKSHGMKPVKVVIGSQVTTGTTEEEDSQEREFQAEESQETIRNGPTEEADGIDVPILFNDDANDPYELPLSPSLPKTSPTNLPLQASSCSQQSTGDHTDVTSVSGDEEEFPSLDKLMPAPAKPPRSRNLKRQSSGLLPAKSKRQKNSLITPQSMSPHRGLIIPPTVWDLSSSPTEPEPNNELSQILGNTPGSPERAPARTPASSRRLPSSLRLLHNFPIDSPILEDEPRASDARNSDSDSASSTRSSASGSEVIRKNGRRIRGVLPASWLRLDQKKDRAVVRNTRNSPEPLLDRGPRRGVALPRHETPKQPPSTAVFLFNESDDSDNGVTRARATTDDAFRAMPDVVVLDDDDDDNDQDDDDGASVVEEDFIDRMLPGRKRAGSSSRSRHPNKTRKKSALSGPGQTSRQPRITQLLSRAASASNTITPSRKGPTRPMLLGREKDGSANKRRPKKRATTPPHLSILDVMEPKAPRFIKIAARNVKKKANLGKASPSRKIISLASRGDNIDALSALQDWKSGKTRPKIAAPSPKEPEGLGTRAPLQEILPNMMPKPPETQPRQAFSFPRKLARQSSLNRFVTVDSGNAQRVPRTPLRPKPAHRKAFQDRSTSYRPAQLETGEEESRGRGLTSAKRSLDALFRRTGKVIGTPTSHRSAKFHDALLPAMSESEHHELNDILTPKASSGTRAPTTANAKSRFRKRAAPQYIDPDAPQYARANDPLPAAMAVARAITETDSPDKLKGLGPYGTVYTQHFEVFPLETGTFFHGATVIGRGYVKKATEAGLPQRIRRHKPAISFVFDEQTLSWGPWDDRTSSEFGILVDWMADQLSSDDAANDETVIHRTIQAADFVLEYILDSLSVQDDDNEKAFISRSLEVLSSFIGRFESLGGTGTPEKHKRIRLEVASRVCVAILAIQSLSRAVGDDPMQSFAIEELLKRLASVAVKGLLDLGLGELKTLYHDLQRPTARERGIRSNQTIANCWVVMMRVLESASIPRSSFWDITHSIMLRPNVASGSDTQAFERLWQDTFTLLPLSEIDNTGLLIPGMRNAVPLEGWTLPQQLLKRVFNLYELNHRQSPSFNEYCRALVARFYFLVQLWGWRKCTGVIGTIFDFFGSQGLEHLRNEEVHRSPRFLDELHQNPSLSIEPGDRCFHIFLKVLALAIQRLQKLGRVNDIKNLVARTLPNHDRQYLKEDTLHHHQLAALRNHHDLLCTLFWVAPPELRPAVHLIERLVNPGSAHKEACLINIRAWNQLARFVISNNEGSATFRPFVTWRNSVFNQVLDQYLSAASDIEQQFQILSKDVPGISRDMRDDMIAKNKATSMDLIHASLKASLDVLQHATSLEATVYALNISQLQKVFTSLDLRIPSFDWGVLQVAIETLEHCLGRIDQVSEEQYSSELAGTIDSTLVDDAVLLVHERITKEFFWMGRTVLKLPIKSPVKGSAGKHSKQAACTEKTVILAARLAARFMKDGLTQLSPYFSKGKHGLFSDMPKKLDGMERRYLPLFLAVLVKNNIFDKFKEVATSLLELWVLSIIKPSRYLGFENYLGEALQRHDLPFIKKATVAVGIAQDYNANHDMFACVMHHMRKSLRETGSTLSKQLRDGYSKTLQLAMQKMKEDLALLRPEPLEHEEYMKFVRQLISLIKSHGIGICVVDPFFTQPSLDYSPPIQDPQLHIAGIIAYGVRLSENEVTAVPQLFHYLYNNFKIALGNDKVGQEGSILVKAMSNSHVLSFLLQFMIPAIIEACSLTSDAWLLLEVYVRALDKVMSRSCLPRELADADLKHAAGILMHLLSWFRVLRDSGSSTPSAQQLYIIGLLATIADMLQPSLRASLYCDETQPGLSGLETTIASLASVFTEAMSHVDEVIASPDAEISVKDVRVAALLSGLAPPDSSATTGAGRNARVQEFARIIMSDVRKNWDVSDNYVTLQMVGRAAAPPTATQRQAGQGTRYGPWVVRELLRDLYGQADRWKLGRLQSGEEERRARGWGVDGDSLIF
ncbi:Mus7/MMS22 family-domain-containing protein [Podospora appendiculata]|uniref:Mus7/MMS22 family-domain-containing protein n=1 Tax=Podospora appendiculata TaxID=314037 RepID=A0AAE0X3D9_9PEZI|nr:Mus7/MMS22 family-domain-containing protein [Podospora appendiculata]